MYKVKKWINKYNKDKILFKAALLALLPIICCGMYLIFQGHWFTDLSLAASEWDDELFYYKQVEAIVNYGYPQGYFGFNESHALSLSFAAWSPVLALPWIIWGFIFGWNMYSPFVCNIVFYSVCLFIFVLLTKPKWRQIAIMALMYIAFLLNVRYMLSSMPEVLVWGNLLVFYGLVISILRKWDLWKLICLFLLGSLMTLMRPYFLLVLMLPIILLITREKGKKRVFALLISVLVLGATLSVYYLINHYLGAPYFAPLYKTEWLYVFINDGIGAGCKNLAVILHDTLYELYYRMIHGITGTQTDGAFFVMHVMVGGLFFCRIIKDIFDIKKKDEQAKKTLIVDVHFFITTIVMFFAIVIMYKLTEGSKHLLTFIAVGMLLLAILDGLEWLWSAVAGVVCIILLWAKWNNPYDYLVPYGDNKLDDRLVYWDDAFSESIRVDRTNAPSYGNVLIWTLTDPDIDASNAPAEDEGLFPEYTDWQMLYKLPAGIGISCCMGDYVVDNFDILRSGYIAVIENGKVDELCSESELWNEIGREGSLVVYARKD